MTLNVTCVAQFLLVLLPCAAFLGPRVYHRYPQLQSSSQQRAQPSNLSPPRIHSKSKNRESESFLSVDEGSMVDLEFLCRLLKVKPLDLLRFDWTCDGVRGVFSNHRVEKDCILLSVPLKSCIVDSSIPSWWIEEMNENDGDDECFSSHSGPSDWAARLAAGLLDRQIKKKDNPTGINLWLSLLPDSEYLKASLPVHWPEDIVASARSTALEIATDSSYFIRAEAVETLVQKLKSQPTLTADINDNQLRCMCNDALDVVQTRSCRLTIGDGDDALPLRVLAPVFDFINHGSSKLHGERGANAFFQREGDNLVVRAMRVIDSNEEVLIDYGDSARPGWKCLLSYGFVPKYTNILGQKEATFADSDDEDNEAEVYLNNQRYTVGPSQIPFEMVAAAYERDHPMVDETEVSLTPAVALHLADRISEVAYYLLLEPEKEEDDDDTDWDFSAFDVISRKEAAALRWSQHHVLLACALNLEEFAKEL